MSVVAANTQPVASDVAFAKTCSPLCLGNLRWSTSWKHQLVTSHILSRSTGLYNGKLGDSLFRGQHGSRVRVGILARDGGAPTGTVSTVVGSDIIVLGLSSDAHSSVAPNGSTTCTPVSQPSAHLAQLEGEPGADLRNASSLVTAETLAADAIACGAVQQGEGENVAFVNQSAERMLKQGLADSTTISSGSSAIAWSASSTSSTAELSTAASVYVAAQAASSLVTGSGAGAEALPSSQPIVTHAVADSSNGSFKITDSERKHTFQFAVHWDRIACALRSLQWGKLWALALLSVSYIHQATTGFALPAMLPMISNELHLTDIQGALLTTGYSYLYAVALVPIGLLADRMSRPKLLAAGLAVWSILTCTASTCRSFGELMLARVGFAAAQGAQNPVCFSLIPELFPVNKSTALSLYNCAIYVGRALSFAAVLLARHLHDNDQAHLAARGGLRMETRLDHLDRADLHSLSIMHTAGDMAAATPDREFNFPLWEYGSELPDSAWRQVLRWIAVPGFLIGLAMMATLQEPRQVAPAALPPPPPAVPQATGSTQSTSAAPAGAALPAPPLVEKSSASMPVATAAAVEEPAAAAADTTGGGIMALLRSPGFMSVTFAAALNDVGSYALIAWQSTFYERVYGLESSAYAPVLAALLPIGGILGGVGGGYLADRLSQCGRRVWVTAGATCVAAPCLAASCLAPTAELSYAALLVGFALSEMWRAPSAVMARSVEAPHRVAPHCVIQPCLRSHLGINMDVGAR
ncbi:hypothetical protein Vretimale_10105 [Volvox reticuliferus]|uniref:Major facilitator superfamily (MFS) profile domain-containing protein n=1 Tax=Volvox reticuliferus TaxID=1737510 RepID=A0A8J4GF51_9CHLO|nr:hypothetical protein Vretifemale_638 [Volvox reticuliferus]GIM05662.1 hypothetical protein Vretimale_10105 [Volvox reticuliferus]